MNIQALSDTELNRAMIWLYPPEHGVIYNGSIDIYMVRYRSMDYLSSWDLTMPLVIDNGLTITTGTKGGEYRAGVTEGIYATMKSMPPAVSGWSSQSKNPLRAICEVLVMIGMEGK